MQSMILEIFLGVFCETCKKELDLKYSLCKIIVASTVLEGALPEAYAISIVNIWHVVRIVT